MYINPKELELFWQTMTASPIRFMLLGLLILGTLYVSYSGHFRLNRFLMKSRSAASSLYLLIILLNVVYYGFSFYNKSDAATTSPNYKSQTNYKNNRMDDGGASVGAGADANNNQPKDFGKLLKTTVDKISFRHIRNVSGLKKKVIAARQKWLCGHCGKMLDETYEVDHIVPIYQGGTNDLDNLMALDPICHKKKTFQQQYLGGEALPL